MKSIKTDWRYQNQEKYLTGLKFTFCSYQSQNDNDHDHCEFCGSKFSNTIDNNLKEGWTDDARYRWICSECFNLFQSELNLKIK